MVYLLVKYSLIGESDSLRTKSERVIVCG